MQMDKQQRVIKLYGIGTVAKLENGFCFSSLRVSSTIGC